MSVKKSGKWDVVEWALDNLMMICVAVYSSNSVLARASPPWSRPRSSSYIKSSTLMKYLHAAFEALIESEVIPSPRRPRREGNLLDLVSGHAAYLRIALHDGGRELGEAAAELGHSDIQYAKLAPDFRTDRDRKLLRLPKLSGKATVVSFPVEMGSKLVAPEMRKQYKKSLSN